MIKVGITNAESPVAGDIIRLLVNHPDVDLLQMCSTKHAGQPVSSVHYGLVGESPLRFCASCNPAEIDVLFICRNDSFADTVINRNSAEKWPELRIIDLTGSHLADFKAYDMVYGLSEMNRKPLVRGAKRAVVPSVVAAVALIALYPAAANLLLNDPLNIDVEGSLLFSPQEVAEIEKEIGSVLSQVQNSFSGEVHLNVSGPSLPNENPRGIRLTIRLNSAMDIENILKVYDSIYDDHNFTHLLTSPVSTNEVIGTHKCLLSFTRPSTDELEISAVADRRMRGAAGEAVHLMNLLFGLHEKTGLALNVVI